MKKSIIYVYIFFTILVFTGCSITEQVVGEYYLQQKQYSDGYKHFEKKINSNKNDAESHYYLARFLLSDNKYKQSLFYLKKAIRIKPNDSKYQSWAGVAYGNLKQYKNERKAYLKAISLNKNNLQAITYLAHNYFDKKEYLKALEYYKKVLKISPDNQFALYNRSLSLNKLKRTPEEILSWKEYLSFYPSGSFANKAVKRLNNQNDFSYKNHLIGFKTVTLKNITFKPFSSIIDSSSSSSLSVLGEILSKNKKISIHIVAYQLNNKKLAKDKVIAIRKYITGKYKLVDKNRLKLSWFNNPRIVRVSKMKYILNEDINFITYVKK